MKLLRESPVEFLEPLSNPPERVYVASVDTGRDTLVLAGTGRALLRVQMNIPLPHFIEAIASEWNARAVIDEEPLAPFIESIRKYFSGSREPIRATVQPVRPTPFTISVQRVIARIPHGCTLTYGDIAKFLGKPGAARAVGTACGKNPVLIVVPCHRVVASHGLGGFGRGGLPLKRRLLQHEGNVL